MTGLDERSACRSANSPESVLGPLDYSKFGKPPISTKILLLIPTEFERFEHISNYEETCIHHRIGRDVELELRDTFGIEFTKVEVLPVQSEDRAIKMLWLEDFENAGVWIYDYVTIQSILASIPWKAI